VKRLFPFVSLGILNYAGRLLVTLFAVGLLLLVLHLVLNAEKFLLDSQKGLKNLPAIYVGKPVASRLGDPSVHPFWPEFPHSDAGDFQSAVINGVQTMTDQWQCNASSDEVLSYYRDQMAGRGWQDVTKETYSLQPELLGTTNGLQNERYIANFRNIMDSKLMLKRGQWSLHISTEPAKGFGQITVKFYAASTPSTGNFFQQMASSVVGNKGQAGRPLDVVQENGSEHYHTTIATKSESPAQAFQAALTDLGSQGWRLALFLPKQQTQSGHFAWLVRGNQYAVLSVTALPQGAGSSVTFMEVSPDAHK
jgi:hypothetical protein